MRVAPVIEAMRLRARAWRMQRLHRELERAEQYLAGYQSSQEAHGIYADQVVAARSYVLQVRRRIQALDPSFDPDPLATAISGALARHGCLAQIVTSNNIDPVAVGVGCADAAALCSPDQSALAARLVMAAESIRRLVSA